MIERIVQGLFKKYVLAFPITTIFLTHGRKWVVGTGWLKMNITYVWLYLDFSAYSDIAVGIGGLAGCGDAGEFQSPLSGQKHHGILGAVAHFPAQCGFAGISLFPDPDYPSSRHSGTQDPDVCKSGDFCFLHSVRSVARIARSPFFLWVCGQWREVW